MIHGAQDNVVVWQHSIKFLKAAVDNGVQLDYFVYPGHEHNVLGKDRVHLMQKVTDYFDEYLKKQGQIVICPKIEDFQNAGQKQ